MPFTNPDLKNLIEATNTFSKKYIEARKTADANRFFGSIRRETKNSERAHGAEWIETLANHINKYAKRYGQYDSRYSIGGSLSFQKNTLLRDTLSGALFLQLSKIQHEYDDAFSVSKLFTELKNSVLASLILPIFQIDSFRDIPADTLKTSILALKEYLGTMTTKSRENQSLLKKADVDSAIAEIEALLSPTTSPGVAEPKQPSPAM